MAKKMQPMGDRVIVKSLEPDEIVRGGIILPDTAKEKPQEAEIIAIGPGRMTDEGQRVPIELKVGDKVIFAKYAGTEIKEGDEEYLVLKETDVLAKIG